MSEDYEWAKKKNLCLVPNRSIDKEWLIGDKQAYGTPYKALLKSGSQPVLVIGGYLPGAN